MDLHKTAIRRKLLKDVKKGIVVGSTHKAHCQCGFETKVTIGGDRQPSRARIGHLPCDGERQSPSSLQADDDGVRYSVSAF